MNYLSPVMDDRGVTHGVTNLVVNFEDDEDGFREYSCGYSSEDTFKCSNCEREMCYCAGHDAHGRSLYGCPRCDECCIKEATNEEHE